MSSFFDCFLCIRTANCSAADIAEEELSSKDFRVVTVAGACCTSFGSGSASNNDTVCVFAWGKAFSKSLSDDIFPEFGW